ncbi:CUB domain-containing protein [Hymenobacter rubidus]|uniref:CUB domain-containing protein n=1 Tax=Hymenobacter rubidus TaxID=1441626 RepID=UPI00191DF25D|nr:CUB domain-containing protein [Hymenobacter rubidus]
MKLFLPGRRPQPRAKAAATTTLAARWRPASLLLALLLLSHSLWAQTYLIGTNQTTCAGNIYDSGGATGTYANNENLTTVLTPATAGAKIQLNFTAFDLESNFDFLKIYDGPTAAAPLLGSFTGTTSPGLVTASNPTGQLTLVFTSDGSVTNAGFAASIACAVNVPTITSFSPTSGLPGTSVVITGLNFTGTTSVTFNGVVAPGFVVNSATQITVAVPSGATTGPIRVITPIAPATSGTNFTVPAPTITSFTPTSGLPGTSVVITGTNFTGVATVSFNNVPAPGFVINSATQITATVPVGAATGLIRVGTAASSTNFTVPAPTVASFTPTSGPAGTSVVVTGTNFTGATAVTLGGSPVTAFTVNSATQITLTVPANAFTGPVCVTTPAGNACSSASYNTGNLSYLIGTNQTTCSGILFDSGGPSGAYNNNENLTSVLTPANGSKVVLTFTAFDLESNFDFLKIYDGPTAAAPLLGSFTGTTIPGPITASTANTTGQLTLVFTSDGSVTRAGFAAGISCLAPPTCTLVTGLTVTNITATSAVLNFTPGIGNNSYVVTYTPTGGTAQTATGTASPITLTGLTPASPYTISIQPICTVGTSPNTLTNATFTTLLPNDEPCGAITLGTAPVNGSNIGATTSIQPGILTPACSPASILQDVWFVFTATATTRGLTVTGAPAGMVRVFTAADCANGPFIPFLCRSSGAPNTAVGSFALNGLTVGTRYYVAVSNYGGIDPSGLFTITSTVTATRAQAESAALQVYPNPSNTGELTLKLSGLGGAGQATLLNALGQLVLTKELTNASVEQTLRTREVAAGLYTLRVAVAGQVLTRKVVLE